MTFSEHQRKIKTRPKLATAPTRKTLPRKTIVSFSWWLGSPAPTMSMIFPTLYGTNMLMPEEASRRPHPIPMSLYSGCANDTSRRQSDEGHFQSDFHPL